ncbi:glycoside hydrolase family 36 N-terminal domain-containing protein [Streptomyces sp. NPDC088137]|uniref:glycoside hydrolase family 36 N-terminal domain-containing protein n=1 Tax=Streptomyces sp. NPDC088137 TaxID=3365827 RepID=UPI003812D683
MTSSSIDFPVRALLCSGPTPVASNAVRRFRLPCPHRRSAPLGTSCTSHALIRPGSDVIERWGNSPTPEPTIRASSPSTGRTLPPGRYRHCPTTGSTTSWAAGTARYSRSATGSRSPRPCSPAAAGVASHHTNPWLTLDDGAADEEHGDAWGTALAWSGSRRITVHRDPVGRTTRTGGFGHEGLSRTIQPGQSLRTPVFACLCTPAASTPPAAPGTPTSVPASCPPRTGTGPSSATRGKPPASASAGPAGYAWPGRPSPCYWLRPRRPPLPRPLAVPGVFSARRQFRRLVRTP